MTITLGGIALPDGTGNTGKLAWNDRESYAPLVLSNARTVGGQFHYRERPVDYGRPITLEAIDGQCWLDETQKDALVALARQGGTVTLDYEGEAHDCIFDHASGAIEFIRKRVTSNDWWFGIIRLITVS